MSMFEGKSVLVTGAAGGIGRAAALQFAAAGATVAVADQHEQGGAETVALIASAGGRARFFSVDVCDEAQVRGLVAGVVEAHGGLHCAFNNAGISDPQVPFHLLEKDAWDRMLSINLTGVFLCMKHEIAHMADHGGGAIVCTSSGAGVVPAPGQPHYTAAKHGILGLVKCAATEYVRQGIRANAILPGVTDTPMLRRSMDENPAFAAMAPQLSPTGVLGTADQVARAAVWLCSDDAQWVNGQSLVVDGGGILR